MTYSNFEKSPLLDKDSKLPVREVPGSYGFSFIGRIKDRYEYFYKQGKDEYFRSRMIKYNSTVFKVNIPPGPFMASDPDVIVLLDSATFPVLFDMDKIEKSNVTGTFTPSLSFTGGYRNCSTIDPSDPHHANLKGLFLSTVASLHQKFIPVFQNKMKDLFLNLEEELVRKNEAAFNTISDDMSFNFVFELCFNTNPGEAQIKKSYLINWLLLQFAPTLTLGLPMLPNFIDDLLLHFFPLPFFPLKSSNKKIYDVISKGATPILDEAEKLGIKRDDAIHNLIYMATTNFFGAQQILYPTLIKWVGLAGEGLHKALAEEIRSIVKSEGSEQGITFQMLDKMALTKSVVYEALRIEPPVVRQYGRAKKNLVINSHDAAYEIKKGQVLLGYQPFATKDPKVFKNPEQFIPDRFLGESGEKLLKYVYWSNGRETENPTVMNKQCPAKKMVPYLSRLMLAEFFLRYDTFTVEIGKELWIKKVKITSVTKATDS